MSKLSATTIRSHVILEIAAGLAAAPDQPLRAAQVVLRSTGAEQQSPLLFSPASTNAGIDAVVRGEAALAIVNPSAALTLAYRGQGAYREPQPVRALAVIPTQDQFVFAVKAETAITYLEDVAARRLPLRIGVRGLRDHYVHVLLAHAAVAAGFTLSDLEAWGGGLQPTETTPPRPAGEKFTALAHGELDAIFDEGAASWLDAAVEAGLTILSLHEETVAKLEAMGYRRATLARERYPKLPQDVLTVDFSGWALFVHADLPDALAAQMCRALDERRAFIAWEGIGGLPVERMCRDAADTPLDVPLHPGAERFWRERGYLKG